MDDKKFHDIRIEQNKIYLDGFKLKGVRNKVLELEKLGSGVYQPVLTVTIGLDPQSTLSIATA